MMNVTGSISPFIQIIESGIIMNVTLGTVLTALSIVAFVLAAFEQAVLGLSVSQEIAIGLALLAGGHLAE